MLIIEKYFLNDITESIISDLLDKNKNITGIVRNPNNPKTVLNDEKLKRNYNNREKLSSKIMKTFTDFKFDKTKTNNLPYEILKLMSERESSLKYDRSFPREFENHKVDKKLISEAELDAERLYEYIRNLSKKFVQLLSHEPQNNVLQNGQLPDLHQYVIIEPTPKPDISKIEQEIEKIRKNIGWDEYFKSFFVETKSYSDISEKQKFVDYLKRENLSKSQER